MEKSSTLPSRNQKQGEHQNLRDRIHKGHHTHHKKNMARPISGPISGNKTEETRTILQTNKQHFWKSLHRQHIHLLRTHLPS